MEYQDLLHFFRSWTRNPQRVGAIAPSSAALAEAITKEITAASSPVIELGPGTGVFTYALLARGIPESDLTLVEYGEDFESTLRRRFPLARVLRMDASKLGRLELAESERAGAIISGLPLLSLPQRKVVAILAGAFDCLRPGGALYQFTYGPSCPVSRPFLDRLGLKAARIGHVLRNLPPASVYRITRRNPFKHAAR
jgi:phosphatidylethanolamine/phosphatidyl-N-methylethanolamine N-methyltransferase